MLSDDEIEKIYKDVVLSESKPDNFSVSIKKRMTLDCEVCVVSGSWRLDRKEATATFSFERLDNGNETAIVNHFAIIPQREFLRLLDLLSAIFLPLL